MSFATNSLIQAIKNARELGRDSFSGAHEENPQSRVVLPILKTLGWDYERTTDDVVFQYRIKGDEPKGSKGDARPDIALQVRNEPKIFVEVKNLAVDLSEWESKLLRCCRDEDTLMGVLTNGFDWRFLSVESSRKRDSASLAEVIVIDDESRATEIARKLENFLRKDRVSSGKALEAFQTAQHEQNLDKAWVKLFENEGTRLHPVFKKELLKLLKRDKRYLPKPIQERIPEFVRKQSEKVLQQQAVPVSVAVGREAHKRNATANQSGKSTGITRIPTRFYISDNPPMDFISWRRSALEFFNILHQKNPASIRNLVELLPNTFVRRGSKSSQWMKRASEIENSGVWVNLHLNASNIRKLCERVCKALDLPTDTIRFEYADKS